MSAISAAKCILTVEECGEKCCYKERDMKCRSKSPASVCSWATSRRLKAFPCMHRAVLSPKLAIFDMM